MEYEALRTIAQHLSADGDEYETETGQVVRLRIEPDEGSTLEDYSDPDAMGRIAWDDQRAVARAHDYGKPAPARPDGFDGRARVIHRDGCYRLWWQPPADIAEDQIRAEAFRLRDIAVYGFAVVGVEVRETVTDSRGAEHDVTIATAWIGGVDDPCPEYVAELVPDLLAEVLP